MSSTSETGHAQNVDSFLSLNTFTKGYGAKYNPSKAAVQAAQLDAMYLAAKTAVDAVITEKTKFNAAVNARVNLFKDNKQLATRIVNAFDTTDASEESKKDIKGFNRKMQGKKAGKVEEAVTPVDPNTPVPKTISSSQQSYNQQIEHLKGMVSALINEPTYKPNETDLKVATLTALITQQTQANADVATAYTDVSNARIERDKILYAEETGLYNTSLDVKKYIKSAFGATSPEYKQVSGIKFSERK